MTQFKDDLGREFVNLSTLSTLLNLHPRQVRRHIRDKRLLSVKRGKERFILKDDILKEYSDKVTASMLDRETRDIIEDIQDTKGTLHTENMSPMSPMSDMSPDNEVTVYDRNKQLEVFQEQSKLLLNRLEKSLADFGNTAQETRAVRGKVDRLEKGQRQIGDSLKEVAETIKALKGQRGHKGHLIGYIVLTLVILGIIGTGVYGVLRFRDFYQRTRAGYEDLLDKKDIQINALSNEMNRTLIDHTKEIGEKDLELERLRITNENLANEIQNKRR